MERKKINLMPLNHQARGDILQEYSSDLLCRPNIGRVRKTYLKELKVIVGTIT
jgi:hypothetical protein